MMIHYKGTRYVLPFAKEEILGTKITVGTPQEVYHFCSDLLEKGKENAKSEGFEETTKIYTPNPEIVMKAEKDLNYREVLNRGSLVVPDGIGVVLASRFRFGKIKKRITGIDLLGHLLSVAAEQGKSVYLLGSKPGVAEEAGVRMIETYPNLIIAGAHHGYFGEDEERRLVSQIAATNPDLLVVALGAPKQEYFIDRYSAEIGVRAAIGVGGALDVWSGNVIRAPKFISKIGMEWLYRVIKQPSRIPRLAVIPKFIFKAAFTRR